MRISLKNKAIGYWLTFVLAAVMVVTAIVYASCFAITDYMSWAAFVFLVIGFAATLVLGVIGKLRFAPAAMVVCSAISVFCFAMKIYNFVATAVVGIDAVQGYSGFVATAVLYAVVIVASIFAVCLEQEIPAKTAV